MGHVKNKNISYIIFKPLITRLFTYLVILFLCNNNFKLFNENKEKYEVFLKKLEKKTIIDIKFKNYTESCPDNYKLVNPAKFGVSNKGCVCDSNLMKSVTCSLFEKTSNLTACKDIYDNTNFFADLEDNSIGDIQKKCNECYNEVSGLPKTNQLLIPHFYKDVDVCYLQGEMSTLEFLMSITEDCHKEERCMDYFCKSKNEDCPIAITESNFEKSNFNPKKPFDFSNHYKNMEWGFDSNYHGYLYLPIVNIVIGRAGMCEPGSNKEDLSYFKTSYPLLSIEMCSKSERFYNIDTRYLNDILEDNGYKDTIVKELPKFWEMNLNSEETWSLQSESALGKDLIYCILNKHSFFIENSFTINSVNINVKDEDKLKNREGLTDKLYVFTHLHENSIFQTNIQKLILYLNYIICFVEIFNFIFKFLNICGDACKFLICLLTYSGYLTFTIDFIVLVTSRIAYTILHHFVGDLNKTLSTGCLDDYSSGMLNVYVLGTLAVIDKNFELFLITLTRLLLIFISIFYFSILKKCKLRYRDLEQIIFGCEEDEEVKEIKNNKEHKLHKYKNIELSNSVNKNNNDSSSFSKNQDISLAVVNKHKN